MKAALHVTVAQVAQTAQDVPLVQVAMVVNLALDVMLDAIHIINNSKTYSKNKKSFTEIFFKIIVAIAVRLIVIVALVAVLVIAMMAVLGVAQVVLGA